MERLARLRRRRLLTQGALANAVGVTPQTIRNWEAGKSWPRATALQRLCEALNVTVEELLTPAEQARVFGEDSEAPALAAS